MKARLDVDNPDQRISEDVKTFTDQTLALFLILTNSAIQLITFSGILWEISPWLFGAAVLYTVIGTIMTVFLGSRLVKLDVRQYRKEADLRYDLIQVRANAEPIALLGGEDDERHWLHRRLDAVVENMKGIIGLSRNISFFTVGYDYLTQLIPLLIVAPLYVAGHAEFGEVTQAAMAFAFVVNAFSLIVKEFQRLSTFGAVVERLGKFSEVLDEESPVATASTRQPEGAIEIVEDGDRVAFERVTPLTPREGRVLVRDLSIQIPAGRRLLITGPSGSGRTSLLRAVAGLWTKGHGRIVRPPLNRILFLPQQPYLRQGTLREQFLYATHRDRVTDERILAALRSVGFESALERLGGLDAQPVGDWRHTLSLGEQQLVAFARLLLAEPTFALLDEPTISVDAPTAERLYEALSATSTTYVSVSNDDHLRKYHDAALDLLGGGGWRELALRQNVPVGEAAGS
jgi:putative ATP-binding cassette transporter